MSHQRFPGLVDMASDDELLIATDDDSFDSEDLAFSTSEGDDEYGQEECDEADGADDDDEDELAGADGGDPAEKEIEGDFDRLVQNIRSNNDPSTSSGLTKDWDFSIEEREAEFLDDLRAASGVGRRRKRGRRRGAGPVLSQQVRSLIGDGNQAYVDNDISEAIRIMQEVIRIEPRAAAAWSVLAQCYEDREESGKALQLRIMAAHLTHDADEWDALAVQSKLLGYNQQALYCYRKVYSLDPSNVDALWDRASLAKETGDFKTARAVFFAILKTFPHDLAVLNTLRPLLIELGDLATCTSLFDAAFTHCQGTYPSGLGLDPVTNTDVPGGGFGLMEVLVLADLYNTQAEHEKAIAIIRRGIRWLQGRSEQRFWDICEDDREFDLPEMSPRLGSALEDGTVQAGGYPLDINARHRLAVARIKMGDIEEGRLHANAVLSQDVLDYAPLFVEIADAYFEKEMYMEARPIYEILGADVATSSIYILLQTAACLRMLDQLKEAAEIYEHVRHADPTLNDAKMKLAEMYESLNEPRKALDLVYEVIDSRRKRGKDVKDRAGASQSAAQPTTSLFEENTATKKGAKPSTRLTHAQIRELETKKEQEVLRGWGVLKDTWADMLKADEAAVMLWMDEAGKLVECFRETRNLFMTSRLNPFRGMFPRSRRKGKKDEEDEERMASRLHLDLEQDALRKKADRDRAVNVFRGVSFDDWLRIIMQYCFLLTQRDQYELADEIIRHILVSNAYQVRQKQVTLRLSLTACAIYSQRFGLVVEQVRKLITMHQFNNEPQRILLACLSSGLRPTDAFITSTLQKHLFREIKLADLAVKNPCALRWNQLNKRYAATGASGCGKSEGGDEEEEMDVGMMEAERPIVASGSGGAGGGKGKEKERKEKKEATVEIPTKHNPILVSIYGQICIAAKSYQSAIFYLLHAYDYCPEDPMVCLCLAIASIGRAMQRQSDNRHHLVAQAMAFLSQYRKLRRNDTDGMAEVEYNFGRAFHQLGLYSHAVKHYERVLELAEGQAPADEMNFTREAAYNLSLIFVMTGAVPLADALYRRWLSI